MAPPFNSEPQRTGATRRSAVGLILGAPLVAGCAGSPFGGGGPFGGDQSAGPQQQPSALGSGQVKVGLLLPLSASGNAGVAAQSMRNSAELALAEFQNPNIQLLVKDDNGSAQGAQQGAQQAVDEGAEIILGPLFALSVPGAAQVARGRGIPMIAFSTDSSVAGRGVYLLSFLPESDVNRIVDYAAGTGKRSFAAFLPENAYGNVVEAAFKQAVARKGGRIVAFEKYSGDPSASARTFGQALASADALLLADDGDALVGVADALAANGADLKRLQLLGTGLWDNPRVFANANLRGGLYAAPDPSGFRSFSSRYRAKYGGDPVRTATLAYDGVALVAALARTQGGQRFSPDVLTNPSGFAGIDGLFRFRSDGTNERGLAVMRATPGGGQIVAGSPKSFGA
ncbi:penicillin-binding protein activator [Bradyrhizobium sp. G127]|uniref:penicillin-binding protein activator n=1 Tax=Bradyrhizobium sp. G127 TaxID=2904800 RepID=UPI001F197AA7|nr:penicillin-binding protein activator [Bradyrhizobium sp. G127]MCF2521263.1 penicillin-binding protein activator [Bradyrhizobium sp. G127]